MEKECHLLKTISDRTRLEILLILAEGEKCVCEIIERLELSQPLISHHLRILRKEGLVKDEKDGKWVFYSLNHEVISQLSGIMNEIFKKLSSTPKSGQKRSYLICDSIEKACCQRK